MTASAAGVMLVHHGEAGDEVLFVRHAERGTWEFPGGMIEDGETAEDAAVREVREEIGSAPYGYMSLLTRNRLTGVDYSTFICQSSSAFEPALSDELTDWQWADPDAPPEPLHPGVRLALERTRMNELDIARAIAESRLSSPQQYENIWLFAMRITGTGMSYRPDLKEHVWRDPGIYLSNEFLDRAYGLPVIISHPAGDMLTQDDYEGRTIGSIMLPYIHGDEVWGIARVYDQTAARVMQTIQLSTSPAVVFRDGGVNETRRLEGGKTLLIEGEPSLLDHLAVCEAGVWDRGGPPRGIAIGEPELAEGPDETLSASRADAIVAAYPWQRVVEAALAGSR